MHFLSLLRIFLLYCNLSFYAKMASWLASMKSVKELMVPMLAREMLWSLDQVRFGPNTTARLDDVILFRQLRSIT